MLLLVQRGDARSSAKGDNMDEDMRLEAHEGHALSIITDEETRISTLGCDKCGVYLIEQDGEGVILYA